jgi:hypothetical protein
VAETVIGFDTNSGISEKPTSPTCRPFLGSAFPCQHVTGTHKSRLARRR